MQTLEYLRQQNDYNLWANGEFLRFLKYAPEAKAARVFAHLLLAEITWLRRMRENLDTSGFDFWAGETVADCEKYLDESRKNFADLFANLTEADLERIFSYKNSKGLSFQNTYREALTHVFFHSAYHRGQTAQAIRLAGNAPPYTDFIQFLRIK
ncbi:MAG: DinB family protein [Acidobacteriota bacterium]|nr:DinB family protein [Acidobacteriota bacterium]